MYVKSKVPRIVYMHHDILKCIHTNDMVACVVVWIIVYGLESGAYENKKCHLSSKLSSKKMREIEKKYEEKSQQQKHDSTKVNQLSSALVFSSQLRVAQQRTHTTFKQFLLLYCVIYLLISLIFYFFQSVHSNF